MSFLIGLCLQNRELEDMNLGRYPDVHAMFVIEQIFNRFYS